MAFYRGAAMEESVYNLCFPDGKEQDHCQKEMESNPEVNPNGLAHMCMVAHDKGLGTDPFIRAKCLQVFGRYAYESIIL